MVNVGDGLWETATVQGSKIHEIEAMGISLPFRSKNGWSDFWR